MEQSILSISLKDYKKQIDELKGSLLGLEQTSDEYKKIADQVRGMQEKLNEVVAVGKKNLDNASGSYNELNQRVIELTKANKALEGGLTTNSEVFRKNAEEIAEMRNKLKEADAQMGLFQRNVGDYKNAFMSAFGEMQKGPVGVVNGLMMLSKESEGLTTRFGTASKATEFFTGAINKVGIALKALIANPIGMFLAAIGVAFLAVKGAIDAFKKGIESSEENTNKYNAILAKFKPIVDAVEQAFQKFASAVLKVISPIVDVIDKTGILDRAFTAIMIPINLVIGGIDLIGTGLQKLVDFIQPVIDGFQKLSDAIADSKLGQLLGLDEMKQLGELEDEIAQRKAQHNKDERQMIEENAELSAKASKAREEAFDKENNSLEQRKKYLKEAHEAEQQEIKNKILIAKETLRISELEASRAGNNAEINKQLAQQRAQLKLLEAEQADNNTKYLKQLNKMNKEEKAIASANARSAKQAEDAVTKRMQLEQKLLQLLIKGAREGSKERMDLEIKLSNKSYEIEKRNINKTITDRVQRNKMVEALEVEHQKELKKIKNNYEAYVLNLYKVDYETQLSYAFKYSQAYDKIFEKMAKSRQDVFISSTKAMIGSEKDFANAMKETIEKSSDLLPIIKNQYGSIENYITEILESIHSSAKIMNTDFQTTVGIIAQDYGQAYLEAYKLMEEAKKSGYDAETKSLEEFRQNTLESLLGERLTNAELFNETFLKLTNMSLTTVAQAMESFDKLKTDEKKLSERWYAEQDKLANENNANRRKLQDESLKGVIVYYTQLLKSAERYNEKLKEIGQLSTETEDDFNKKTIESDKAVYETRQQLIDAYYLYAESQKGAEGEYDALREKQALEHKNRMVDIAKEMYSALQNISEENENERLRIQQEINKKIEAEEKRHNKALAKIDLQQRRKEAKNWRNSVGYALDATSSIISVMDDYASYKENQLNKDVENGEKSREQAEKEFEAIKDLQVASTAVNMLASLVSINTSVWDPKNPMPVWSKIALSATESAAALMSGHLAIQQIKQTKFGDDGGSGSGSSSRSVEFNTIGVNPLLDENADYAGTQDVRVVQDNTNDTDGDNRVYILQSDISKSNKQVQIRENNTTF